MTEKIICAGFGGQGIMLMGQILTRAGLNQGRHVSWLPAYGAEVRGGTAHCQVVISDKEIASPAFIQADSCIVMNEPSLISFESRLKAKGLLLVNSSLAQSQPRRKDLRVYRIPFTEIAVKLGNIKVANSVALGVYIAAKKIFTQEDIFRVMAEVAPRGKKELIQINQEAIRQGAKRVSDD
jgi:2-oxoglutarate ferredoxin oxidoreductase subunit gamma